jgi:hypothetical protein
MRKTSFSFFSAWVLAAVAGCYRAPRMDYASVKLVSAHGVVTLDQQPLAQATVIFETPDKQFSYGTTDASGKYALQFDSNQPGVTPGPKVVRISSLSTALGEGAETVREDGAAEAAPAERVPARYNQQSELKVDVSTDRTEYNFDLTSK